MTLRAGLVGLGMMGRHHRRVLGSLEGVELVGAVDPAHDPLGVAAGLPIFETLTQLLDVGIDYCVLAAPTGAHLDLAMEVANAGVSALIEKPLAQDPWSARKIVEAFNANNLLGAVGHIERYNPALQSARSRLADGELGTVYQIVTRRQGPFPGRIADVGVIKDLGTHDIDLTAWVTQQPFATIFAHATYRSGRAHEDLVAAVGTLSGGAVTNHLVNWLSPMKERVTIITGERGTFVADTLSADLTLYANASMPTDWGDLQQFRGVSEGDMIRYAIAKPEPLRTEHQNFRDALLGRPADIVTLEQGLATVLVAEAMIESHRTGSMITLRDAS